MTSTDKHQRLLEGQVRILKLIVKDTLVEETLAALTAWWKKLSPAPLPASPSSIAPSAP